MNVKRLGELIDAWRDGELTEATAAEFSQLLRDSEEARRVFRAEAQTHGLLHLAVMAEAVEKAARSEAWRMHSDATEAVDRPRPVGARSTSRKLLLAGACVLVLGVVAALVWLHVTQQPEPPRPFATLTRATDPVWDGPTHPRPGDRLTAGALNLRRGTAEIRLASGVDLLVEAPARMELVDVGNSVLHAGRLVVRVPSTATGYAVDAPKVKVVDLGTEFGVDVQADGETVVQVFAGSVVAELKKPSPSGTRSRRLVAGETVHIAASDAVELQRVAFSPERFLRTFSTPSVHEGDVLIPFKPSQTPSLDVLAAPGQVTVDGDLSDWNLSGVFESRCAGAFAESCFVRGSMMYDKQYLYVAARVGDPMPMRNVIDPRTDPWSAWMGGSAQLRLSTDRTFGWPVGAMKPSCRPGEADPQDTSGRIIHLTLWYFQPRDEPCLEIRYGMDFDRGVVNPPGWRGAFRKTPDGKGYTLECAIPWTLLGAESDPPRAGDELGLSWTVNWSDASGKRWKGQLVEIKNPLYAVRGKLLTHMYAETWGKAIYR
jgi:ferric-dicitrate binding protein FerR (iron transport regulator)